MKYTYLALAVQEPSGWVAVSISVLALIATLGNYCVTLWRGRKHVRMHVRIMVEGPPDKGETPRQADVASIDYDQMYTIIYSCEVTNSGFIGVTIDHVVLYLRDPGLRNRFETYIRLRTGHIQPLEDEEETERRLPNERLTRLRLLKDEDPRKLDPGESQAWGVYIKGGTKIRMLGRLRHARAVDTTQIIAVAVDTTGKIYWQKTKDAITKNDLMTDEGLPPGWRGPETPGTLEEEPERAEPRSAMGGAQEPVWRRWFRG